jgi:hypothetical protein
VLRLPLIGSIVLTLTLVASAEVLIEDLFDTGDNRVAVAGTAKAKYADAREPAKNLPGGKWIKVAGYEWSDPYIPAKWDETRDYLNLGENITGVAISLKDHNTGVLHIMADLNHTSSDRAGGTALGFYAKLTAPNTRKDELANFTGIMMCEKSTEAGFLQLYEAGKPVGEPVAAPAIELGKFYNLQYDVDTRTGKLSNVMFDGKPIAMESAAFNTAATQYAGVVTSGGQNGRGAIDSFQVSRQNR